MKQTMMELSILASVASCGAIIPVHPPMTAVPGPTAGEIDEFLPEVRASLASDFPSVKILRLESGQRVWSIAQAPSGVATRRYAMVHLSFEVAGKCYYQPRAVFQEAGARGWAAIETSASSGYQVFSTDRAPAGPLTPNPDRRLQYKTEALTPDGRPFGAAYPIDCAAINKTLAFRPCTPTEAATYGVEVALCPQDGATPAEAKPAAAPAANPAPLSTGEP